VANETPGQSSFNKNGRLWNDLVVSLEGENIEKKKRIHGANTTLNTDRKCERCKLINQYLTMFPSRTMLKDMKLFRMYLKLLNHT